MTDSGNLYVISAPSGTGKTTLVKALIDSLPKITVSISHTTRPKRPAEMHGVNYYFVDQAEFQHMIKQGDFLEYATIFDHSYGTSKSMVKNTLLQGIDVILEIDWQGNQNIKRLFPNALSIFMLPPSLEDLRERLVNRRQDQPDVIEQRLQDVRETISHVHDYDYLVMNDNFDTALHDIKIIIESGRLLRKRQAMKYAHLIKELAAI